MTHEQKQEALAAFDLHAEIFGPRLAFSVDFDVKLNCCCSIGVLGLLNPRLTENNLLSERSPDARFRMDEDINTDLAWIDTGEAFGLDGVEVYGENDGGPDSETPEQRFTRMRQWFADRPTR